MKKNQGTLTGAALCTALLAAAIAGAAEKYADVKYVPPQGFAGHKWGELRFTFDRLSPEPLGVGAGWINPQQKEVSYSCQIPGWIGPIMNDPVPGCVYQSTLTTLNKTTEGGGFYVLSEYTIDGQGFRMGDEQQGVVLHPIVYQFCANWDETQKKVPEFFETVNKFCGVRLVFQSESHEELAKLPADHLTVYDRLLEKLLAKYGQPDRFVRRGQVVIESPEGDSVPGVQRKYSTWRWCPARDSAFHTDCTASVTLTIDPPSGQGMVLYSTPRLWEYAFAREKNGYKGDWLYKILHAHQ